MLNQLGHIIAAARLFNSLNCNKSVLCCGFILVLEFWRWRPKLFQRELEAKSLKFFRSLIIVSMMLG